MSVSKAVGKLCPVFFLEGFLNPALEGAKIVDSDFGNVGEEETKVLDDVVLGVEIWTSHWADIVAACRQHLLHRAIGGGAYNLSKEVHLSRCDHHVADARDVIEHPSNMFIMDAFILDSCDQDIKDSVVTAMKEDFKLVGKSSVHGPGFASP